MSYDTSRLIDEPDDPYADRAEYCGSCGFDLTLCICSDREVRALLLLESELNEVATLGSSMHFTLLGIFFGAFIAVAIVWGTVPLSQTQHMAFVGSFWASLGLSFVSAINAGRDYRRATRKLAELKTRTKEAVLTLN
jgi:hypothetical protein